MTAHTIAEIRFPPAPLPAWVRCGYCGFKARKYGKPRARDQQLATAWSEHKEKPRH